MDPSTKYNTVNVRIRPKGLFDILVPNTLHQKLMFIFLCSSSWLCIQEIGKWKKKEKKLDLKIMASLISNSHKNAGMKQNTKVGWGGGGHSHKKDRGAGCTF